MKKNILYLISVYFLLCSCEKDNITNNYIDDNPNRINKISTELKKLLVSSPNGWVMMVKSSLSEEVYTPIVMKFDTLTNTVRIKTVYGINNNNEDFFRIALGTGYPQLIFTTGSIMTTLYRVGIQASDITDHIYNVLKVSDDEIQIQPYRSGNVYTKEGGVIYKLFKRPIEWEWAEDELKFDWTNINTRNNIDNITGKMEIEYLDSETTLNTPWAFITLSNANTNAFRTRDPFSIAYNTGTGGFLPSTYFRVYRLIGVGNNVTSTSQITVTNGHNAISIYPIPYNTGTNQNVVYLASFLKTHYLIFKKEERINDNVKMEFEAYNREGKVIVKAFYDNLK